MKARIALDFDDVLFPFMTQFVAMHNDRYGSSLLLEHFHTFEFHVIYGGSRQASIERVTEILHLMPVESPPLPGAVEGIIQLHEEYEIAVVTSRNEEFRPAVHAWLDHHVPGRIDSVHFCNHYVFSDEHPSRTKAEVVAELNAVGLVDDSPAHVAEVIASGRRGVLFGDYPWNRSGPPSVEASRVDDWSTLVDRLLMEPV